MSNDINFIKNENKLLKETEIFHILIKHISFIIYLRDIKY